MVKIKTTKEFGKGVYATRDIYAGELIEVCEILVLSEVDTKVLNSTDLQWYTFVYNSTQDCLVLGNGEIFNHSDDANVSYKLKSYKDRKVMVFMSIKDISEGSQLFTDYSADSKNIDTLQYVDKNLL